MLNLIYNATLVHTAALDPPSGRGAGVYLHVEVSSISCRVAGSIPAMPGKTLTHKF